MLEKTFRTMIEDISVFYIFQSLCYRNGPLILNHVLIDLKGSLPRVRNTFSSQTVSSATKRGRLALPKME